MFAPPKNHNIPNVFIQDLKENSTDPEMSKIAKAFLDSYRFPVMMMIASPEGKVIHAINANEFLDKEQNIVQAVVSFE